MPVRFRPAAPIHKTLVKRGVHPYNERMSKSRIIAPNSRILTPRSGPDILIRRRAHAMESKRRILKEKWGPKYKTRILRWRSLIVMQMKKKDCGAIAAGAFFKALLKGRGKLTTLLEYTITAASLDAAEAIADL